MTVQPVVMVSDASNQSVEEVGGKALTLAKLSALGLPVPPGFIVTASLLERSAALIRASVEHALSAPSFAHATTFAVRSSAVAEDLAAASFAG
jgi:phosphoenolpyruvate synthase/pyruvate phosphate dikinase